MVLGSGGDRALLAGINRHRDHLVTRELNRLAGKRVHTGDAFIGRELTHELCADTTRGAGNNNIQVSRE